MGLFTSLIFNNGVDHTFVDKGQIPSSNSIIRQYIEPAAAQAAQSKFTIKHDLASKTINRSLLQRTVNVAGSDGVLYPITINTTVTCNKLHSSADVVKELELSQAAQTDASFNANFVIGLS